MTNTNIPSFHSGKRLQILRSLQGMSLSRLAAEFNISSSVLMTWEDNGIPKASIEQCSHYFEVSRSIFSTPVNNAFDFEQVARTHLFPSTDDRLQARLRDNKIHQTTVLDLSGLRLSEVPIEVFSFSWLVTLNLQDNQLKHIPSHILLLQQLEILNISDNLLIHIPGILNALTHLTNLNFQGNPLTSQTILLDTNKSLSAYQTYLADTAVTIAVIEQLTQARLQDLDDIRAVIEPAQPVIRACVKTCAGTTTHYQRASSITYITAESGTEQLSVIIDTLHPNKQLPLILFIRTPEADPALPTPPFADQIAHNKAEFFTLFSDIQRKIAYQNQIPNIKFESLELHNIGVYEHITIPFNSDITVFIGLNGAGKTTILKALTLAILGPEQAEMNADTAANILRIIGKQQNQIHWQAQGWICAHARINGKPYKNTIHLRYNTNREKVEIKGQRFDALFEASGHLRNLILGIGEHRNTRFKKPQTLGLEVMQAKAKDLLPIISEDEQTCMAHFSSWIGNLALAVSQGDLKKQQEIDASFAVFSALMQESIEFCGLTKVDPLELWIEHQNPKQMVPLRLVSQGYQAVMGWVGYVLQRMYEVYADALHPLQQPAIIIIDEIDQLLHVKWQQKILHILSKQFFPNTQWIVSTHSPMVVTGLEEQQIIHLHQQAGKLIAEPNSVDLWLWQYGDIVRHLFEVSSEIPKAQEQQLIDEIQVLTQIPPSKLTTKQQQTREKLEVQLDKIRKSRAFVDEIYAEQQKLRTKERTLTQLIEQLKTPT